VGDSATANRFVVTGAAGFLGSHLCEALLRRGHRVIGVDDLSSGRSSNLAGFTRHPAFTFREADVLDGVPVHGPVDGVFHLIEPTPAVWRPDEVSAAAPADRLPPLPTGIGVASDIARRRPCRLLLVVPSGEDYEDPFDGSRKDGAAHDGLDGIDLGADDVRVARLFHAYGPRMEDEDEPTVMRLLLQALTGQPMVIDGDGEQTRGFCFVSDLINGMLRLFRSNLLGVPVDLGDPTPHRVDDLVDAIRRATGSEAAVEYRARRLAPVRSTRPDITLAAQRLGWAPRVSLGPGLDTTARWLRAELGPTVGHRRPMELRTA
jgi:nucleoside-diphosphate-sugar epimerase